MKKKLLVLTSGGDSPGLNAGVRAVVRSGYYHDVEIFGCHDGYLGLIKKEIFPMAITDVANTIQRGGTLLRTKRVPEFHQPEVRQQCIQFLHQQEIDFLVTLGGDGTFRGAFLLEKEGGPKVIGIPGSIDNDVVGSDYAIGYDTARNTALQAIDKIRDTAASHSRYFLVETMGRNSGFLALDVAIGGGAEFALIPEFPISIEQLAEKINHLRRTKQSLIIVVAEAGQPGRSLAMAEKLQILTAFEYRVCVLGHTQRGGSPTALDRVTASYMGNMAVESLLKGKSSCMVAIQKGQYTLAPFPDPNKPARRLIDDNLIKLMDILSI